MFQQPYTVAVLCEPDAVVGPEALAGIQQKLATILQLPPARVACRLVARASDHVAAALGFPELAALLHIAPRLVVRMKARPWDAWLTERLVPLLDWPPDLTAQGSAIAAARSVNWLEPILGGVFAQALNEAREVVIGFGGTPFLAKEEGILQIGLGLLTAFGTPAPDFVLRSAVDVSVPVRDPMTVIGYPLGSAGSRSLRTVPFRASLADKEEQESLNQKTLAWMTWVDGESKELSRSTSILFSPFRHVALASSGDALYASPPAVLAAAIRKSVPEYTGTIRVRQTESSMGVIQPHEAMERVASEESLGLRWEVVPDSIAGGDPIVIHVLDTDWRMGEATKDLIGWVAQNRAGLHEQTTIIATNPEVRQEAEARGLRVQADPDAVPEGIVLRLAPLPLMPVA